MKKSKLKIGLISLAVVGAILLGGWWIWRNQLLDRILVSKLCEEDSDCTFTQCCGCASRCRKICNKKPFALPCECEDNQCVVKQTQQVTITTDKTEYEQGETVKITVRNGLDKSIFWGFGHCGGLPFWGLQKFDNGVWRDLDFSLPYSEKGREVCDLILCEREEPAELKSGLTIEDRWHLTSICEWPEKPIGVPQTKPKPIEEGTYGVRLIYGLNRREFDLLEIKTIYSNKFRIKEVISQQILDKCKEEKEFIKEVQSDPDCLKGEESICVDGWTVLWYYDRRLVTSTEFPQTFPSDAPEELKDATVAEYSHSVCSCEKPISYRILQGDNLGETTCEKFYKFIEDYNAFCNGCILEWSFECC